ncbi:MAG TPA: DUF4058 family protein [Chloroflexota bacterium]|nr:DUF4058 family protein [Chloroflexota bacterium]
MSSPFPGMDPYLERSDRWGGVHSRLIAVIGEALASRVAPRFFVDSEDYVYILGREDPGRSFIRPDISVVEAAGGGGLSSARARIAAPMLLEMPEWLEIHAPYLKIIDTRDRQVVTTIEVLSPINKVPGSSGQREFLRKREHVLSSTSHWLEIDLLRAGTRPPAIPPHDGYNAMLHRARIHDRLEGWFASLRQPLPTIAVPLTAPFEDVPLDLQEAVDTVYTRYRYDAAIDYDEEPPLPGFSPADAAWVRERIAAWRGASGS